MTVTEQELKMWCCRCNLRGMSPMDMQNDPDIQEAEVKISQNVQKQDPKNPENVIRVQETNTYIQKPARICIGCYEDLTETPTAAPRFVVPKQKG